MQTLLIIAVLCATSVWRITFDDGTQTAVEGPTVVAAINRASEANSTPIEYQWSVIKKIVKVEKVKLSTYQVTQSHESVRSSWVRSTVEADSLADAIQKTKKYAYYKITKVEELNPTPTIPRPHKRRWKPESLK